MLTAVNSGTVCVEGRRNCVNRCGCTYVYVMYTYACMCVRACLHVSIRKFVRVRACV